MTKLKVAFHNFANASNSNKNKFIVYEPPVHCVHKQEMYWKNIITSAHLNNTTGWIILN